MTINSSTSMAKQPLPIALQAPGLVLSSQSTYFVRPDPALKSYQIIRRSDGAVHEKTYATFLTAEATSTKMELGLLRFVPETKESLDKKVARIA